MENALIRNEARKHGIKHWEIAERLGIAEATFCRKLRRELPSDQQKQIIQVIHAIAAKKGAAK